MFGFFIPIEILQGGKSGRLYRPLGLCLAVKPKIIARALEITHSVISSHYRKKVGLQKSKAKTGAVTPSPLIKELSAGFRSDLAEAKKRDEKALDSWTRRTGMTEGRHAKGNL